MHRSESHCSKGCLFHRGPQLHDLGLAQGKCWMELSCPSGGGGWGWNHSQARGRHAAHSKTPLVPESQEAFRKDLVHPLFPEYCLCPSSLSLPHIKAPPQKMLSS